MTLGDGPLEGKASRRAATLQAHAAQEGLVVLAGQEEEHRIRIPHPIGVERSQLGDARRVQDRLVALRKPRRQGGVIRGTEDVERHFPQGAGDVHGLTRDV